MSGAGPTADRFWMQQALALGALAEGATSPNPRVGCLVVRDGRAIGRGYHRAPGQPHAETMALSEAGAHANGATLYVNLEPCAHQGRTPPCTEALISRGIRRVVAAIQDPNPLVNGRGFEQLRAAGVEVEVGLLADSASRLNEAFLHAHRAGRPLVTLKAACSLDGRIAAAEGRSRWITGVPARRFAHRLRLRHDAVLVGAETVRRDDPRLTIRLPGVAATRRRVVLAPQLDLDPESACFDSQGTAAAPTLVYASPGAPADRERLLHSRAEVVRVNERDGRLDLNAVLSDLSARGVHSVLVEGGARTFAGFVEAGLADRAALFYSDKLLGARDSTPLLDLATVRDPAAAWRLTDVTQLALGHDLLLRGWLQSPGHQGAEARCSRG